MVFFLWRSFVLDCICDWTLRLSFLALLQAIGICASKTSWNPVFEISQFLHKWSCKLASAQWCLHWCEWCFFFAGKGAVRRSSAREIIYTFIIDSNSKANLLAWGFFFIPKSHAPPKVGLRRHVIFCANVCLQLVCFSKDGCHQSLWMTVSPPPPPTLSFTSWAKSVPKKMRRKNGVLCFRKFPQNRCTRCCYWASSFLLLILNFRDYVFVFACIVYVYSK